MGIIHSMLRLSNPRRPDLPPIEVKAMVDTASVIMAIPEWLRAELDLHGSPEDDRVIVLADGSRRTVAHVGPLEVHFKDRLSYCGALVMGDEVLLGAIAMEDMDLILSPADRSVNVNPVRTPIRI